MFRWKKEQPGGETPPNAPSGPVATGDSNADSFEISAPPLKPFTRKGSHTPAKPPAAPTFQAPAARRLPPDIPGLSTRSSERATAGSQDGRRLVIGRDISISGEVASCDRLLVEGRAEIDLPNTHQLEVTPSGLFRGSAEVEVADISGRFEGDLTARGQLVVRSGGQVSGTIRYGHIIIEAGGQVTGDMQALTEAEGPAAQLNPKPQTKPNGKA
ncbi:MAG: polymer-forming cytoskeletal protein [Rhodospirillales bacterium]|nr:polymer-forming cytoskeletal protein [Alphaproteobacteria bacterium]MBL6948423.1 polymer-forming cytoskeletal protein [Rhodospirillales bacterium]